MQFDLRQLEIFVAVADEASFSRAGKVLGLAQASVSERIANLEKAVGAKLLDRMGRKAELTAAGVHLIGRAREMLALRDQTSSEMRSLLAVPGGRVNLGGSTAPGEFLLPKILGSFLSQYPKVTVGLHIADSGRILDRIEVGATEIGVVGRRVSNEGFTQVKVWNDRLVLAVPPAHPLAGSRRPVEPGSLVDLNWIVREAGSGTRIAADKQMKKMMPRGWGEMKITAEMGSVAAIKEGVRSGLGVAMLSEVTVKGDVDAGALATVAIKDMSAERGFYLVRDKRRTPSPAADALWRHIRAEARSGNV